MFPTPNDGRSLFSTGQAGQALSEIEGACQKAKRRTRQYLPPNENNRYNKSVGRGSSLVTREAYYEIRSTKFETNSNFQSSKLETL